MGFMPESTPFQAIEEQFEALRNENEDLRESLDNVRRSLAFEDRGWTLITGVLGNDHSEGLTLDEVKDISETIRPYVVGGSLMQRGANLRRGYVWAKGIHIEGVEPSKKAGAPSRLRRFYERQVNQDNLFGASAHSEMERCAYTDGVRIALCYTALDEVRSFPLEQVSDIRFNPDFPDEIWAIQRTWPAPESGKVRKEWFYTNKFTGARQQSLTVNNERVPVAANVTAVVKRFNRQTGWPMGLPDSIAALPWYEAYSEIMRYGRVVNEALSKMLYKITTKSGKAATATSTKVKNATGHGQTAVMTDGQDLQAINTAGKGYDFTSARPVAAMMAAALDVPNIELLSDSAAAGSSYGAAQSLTPSTINAMRFRQDEWVEFFQEVFKAFGIDVPKMWFDPIQEPDPYREMQRSIIAWGTGLLHADEGRSNILDILDVAPLHDKAPEGVMLPNNTASLPRKDVDTDMNTQAASPDQGRGNDTGGNDVGANDMRTDILSNALTQMRMDEMRELVERFEATAIALKGDA